jgi:hypothetical protein
MTYSKHFREEFMKLTIHLIVISCFFIPLNILGGPDLKEYSYHYELRSEGDAIGSLKTVNKQIEKGRFKVSSHMTIKTSYWGFSYHLTYLEESILDDKGIIEFTITLDEDGSRMISSGKRIGDQLAITVSEGDSVIANKTIKLTDFDFDPFTDDYFSLLQDSNDTGEREFKELGPWGPNIETFTLKNLGSKQISWKGKPTRITVLQKSSSGEERTELWIRADGVTVYFKGEEYEAFLMEK